MPKGKRDLVKEWREAAEQFSKLAMAYEARDVAGDIVSVPLSNHYSDLSDLAARHAMQLDTGSSK